MKTTINKKTYNTETSAEVAEANNGGQGRDFRAWWETIYLSRKGNWFLHGRGGALSQYAETYIDGGSYGEKIIPMTPEEVLEWCEEHGAQDAIDEHFADVVEEA